MAEYSRIAKGKLISNGGTNIIRLPFQPDTVQFWNYTLAGTAATSQNILSAYWDANMGQGFAIVQGYNATPALIYDIVTANGISTFSAGLSMQFGASKQIIGATAANPIVFNVTAHGYAVGDIVIFSGLYQSATTGMPQISDIPFVISAVGDADHFSVVWPGNGSNYTALSGSPTGAFVKKVLYPFLYAPGVSFIEAITTGTTTTVVTTAPHNMVVGQEVAFRISQPWGTVQLNSLPNSTIPGSPIYGYVQSVTNATTVVVNINSTGYTAFTTNVTVAGNPGRTPPQMIAVGDVNSGGVAYSGGALYPSPVVNGASTINGPAISGAFVNNTSQGFIIGNGAGAVLTTGVLSGASTNVLYWEAKIHDMSIP